MTNELRDVEIGEEFARRRHIVEVLHDAFAPLMIADPRAFRKRFHKMAADPFAFYRGSAPLFYADVVEAESPVVGSGPCDIWIQGDLHAENYGTYLNANGLLVFDVNDFDEAYLGPFWWDLERMAASLALIGFAKAFSDDTIKEMIAVFVRAYASQVRRFATGADRDLSLSLASVQAPLRAVLNEAGAQSRSAFLDAATIREHGGRRFRAGPGVRVLDDAERQVVVHAYVDYLETVPKVTRASASISFTVKDVVARSGLGIGSAGLSVYSLLVEGRTQALDDDVILSMKQGNVAALSRVVSDDAIRSYFKHDGHRTAMSQRALQSPADPWLGYTEIQGLGYVVQEISPYTNDLSWDELVHPDDVFVVLEDLGRAAAKAHCLCDTVVDERLAGPHVISEISAAIGDPLGPFVARVVDLGLDYGRRARCDHRLFVDAFRNGDFPDL